MVSCLFCERIFDRAFYIGLPNRGFCVLSLYVLPCVGCIEWWNVSIGPHLCLTGMICIFEVVSK